MNSPAPNIPGAVSTMSPFTEYIMNELELEATSEDDIRAGDETSTRYLLRITPTTSVVTQHRQVARQ
jgi:hypothetical protein